MIGPLEEYEREELIAAQRETMQDLYDEWACEREQPDTDIDQQDDLYARGAY
jgi:hypothetical protein